jgi:excisionase family DNA binding protein
VKTNPRFEVRNSKAEGPSRTGQQGAGDETPSSEIKFTAPLRLLTRTELAQALRVAVRTIDEMLAADEIPVVRVRNAVRFYLPDVVRSLTANAVMSKRGCAHRLAAEKRGVNERD